MILHYSTEGSIHVSDNLEDVLSQIGMNANDIALAKVKYYVLHTQMISILLYLTAKPLLHASQPDKIIGTTRSTPGQSVFDNVCFVPDSKRHSDKFKRYFEDCFWTRKKPQKQEVSEALQERRRPDLNRWILVLQTPKKILGTR